MKKFLFPLCFLLPMTASAAQCNLLHIESIYASDASHMIIKPQTVGVATQWWQFYINPQTNSGAVDVIKLAFVMGKPVTFVYVTKDDDENIVADIACTGSAFGNAEGARTGHIISATILAN